MDILSEFHISPGISLTAAFTDPVRLKYFGNCLERIPEAVFLPNEFYRYAGRVSSYLLS
jgi:hypothetical protein